MAMYTQANQPASVTTPLADDKLLMKRFVAEERLGRPFRYELTLLSEDAQVKYDDLVGETMSVKLAEPGGGVRWFSGIVQSFGQIAGTDRNLPEYRAVLVPSLWYLSQTADCRIWGMNVTAGDVIKKLIGEAPFPITLDAKMPSLPQHEYIVQYRETHLDFITRLMEEAGLYYYFTHGNDSHTMHLTDGAGAPAITGGDTVPFMPEGTSADDDGIIRFEPRFQIATGKIELTDYDLLSPSTDLKSESAKPPRTDFGDKLVAFDYPGRYMKAADGKKVAAARRESLHQRVFHGRSDHRGICPGHVFTLEKSPRDDLNEEYLITSMRIEFEIGGFGATHAHEIGFEFDTTFTAIRSNEAYRLPNVTPKGFVHGPQTAKVIGDGGDGTIHPDEHGRIKVQFHWDNRGHKKDDACWLRVAQPWAGMSWGAMAIPRIGDEVLVAFLEGDPDRPIVVGSVYNGENAPPYDLSSSKELKTTFKTSKNELRFMDDDDAEEVYLLAGKDALVEIENDHTTTVKNDQTLTVENDQTTTVKNDQTVTVENDQTVDVAKKITIEAGDEITLTSGQASIKLAKNGDITIKGMKVTVEGTQEVSLKSDMKIDLKSSLDLKAKGLMVEVAGDAMAKVKGPMVEVAGDAMAKLKGGVTMLG